MRARTELTTTEIADILSRPTATYAEAAGTLRCGETAFRGAMRREELALPVITIGARRVIPTAALRRLLSIEVPERSDTLPATVLADSLDGGRQ